MGGILTAKDLCRVRREILSVTINQLLIFTFTSNLTVVKLESHDSNHSNGLSKYCACYGCVVINIWSAHVNRSQAPTAVLGMRPSRPWWSPTNPTTFLSVAVHSRRPKERSSPSRRSVLTPPTSWSRWKSISTAMNRLRRLLNKSSPTMDVSIPSSTTQVWNPIYSSFGVSARLTSRRGCLRRTTHGGQDLAPRVLHESI